MYFELHNNHFTEANELIGENIRRNHEEMDNLKSEFEDSVKSFLSDEQEELYYEFTEKDKPPKGPHKQGCPHRN